MKKQISLGPTTNLRSRERLSFTLEENSEDQSRELTFIWSGTGTLQYSNDLEVWTDVPDVFPPYSVAIGDGAQPFWRILETE